MRWLKRPARPVTWREPGTTLRRDGGQPGRGAGMEWGRFALAGLLCGVGYAFHLVVPVIAPEVVREYERRELFRPWDGWTGWYMLAHPWLYGFVFAGVFLALRATVGPDRLGGPVHGLLYGVALFV